MARNKRRTRSTKRLPVLLAVVIVFSMVWLMVWVFVTADVPISNSAFNSGELIQVTSFSDIPGLDSEWMDVLREGKIVDSERYHNGLSEKYKVVFDSGHMGMIKPAEFVSIFGSSVSVMTWDELHNKRKGTLSRADRKYQGWAEIAAFYLDRVMGFNKKPPITGRIMTNKELFALDNTWNTLLKKHWPTFPIRVAMHAWVEELKNHPPGPIYMKYLTQQKKLEKSSISSVENTMSISDALVFDLLVDDHDKKWDFNWKATTNNMNLHWDSGLGWRHGPFGLASCLDILCGTSAWIEENTQDDGSCIRISRFRNSTIQYLKDHSGESPYEHKLSTLWRESMKSDALYPIFNLGSFWDRPAKDFFASRVKFEEQAFIDGLDYKIGLLLSWVEECIQTYGESNVLY